MHDWHKSFDSVESLDLHDPHVTHIHCNPLRFVKGIIGVFPLLNIFLIWKKFLLKNEKNFFSFDRNISILQKIYIHLPIEMETWIFKIFPLVFKILSFVWFFDRFVLKLETFLSIQNMNSLPFDFEKIPLSIFLSWTHSHHHFHWFFDICFFGMMIMALMMRI